MVTGFLSYQAEALCGANAHVIRHASVAKYMDTVNTVNILYSDFIADVFFQM